jgi:hypothetical protein
MSDRPRMSQADFYESRSCRPQWRDDTLQRYRDHLQERLTSCGVPDHLHAGLLAYLVDRRRPGSFLSACLENNLLEALLRAAPPVTAEHVTAIVQFLTWHAPATAWGSSLVVETWLTETSHLPTPFD